MPRLLGRAQVSLFARMRGVVKLPQGSKEQANEQVGCCSSPRHGKRFSLCNFPRSRRSAVIGGRSCPHTLKPKP